MLTVLAAFQPGGGQAASFAAQDLQVLGRAIAFLQTPPAQDAVIAIAYAAGDAASRRDAEDIAALIGSGLQAGQSMLRPKLVDVSNLGAAGSAIIIIAAAGAAGSRLNEAARAAHALCVTTDTAAVRSGFCTMAITTEPRVEILVNHAVAEASGVEFVAAFRMMIREM
jgi:hypothetical protein